MKTFVLLFVFASGLMLAGCGYVYGPVKLSEDFSSEKADVIDQMVKKIKSSPTLDGVADARAVFEGKKAGLSSKRDAIKASPQGLNSDWSTNLYAIEIKQRKVLDDAAIMLAIDSSHDQQVIDKFKALQTDFNDAVKR